MFVASNFVLMVARLLELVVNVYIWIIIARALISWVNPDPSNAIVRFLYRVTEPVLRQVRYRMPDMGGLDLSPMVVILLLYVVDWFVVSTLRDFALGLR
ncbi:MAG: YggT family protein [Candidatus Rokubacteria bacterium]|nr:YggT family protein [Candidatus Rokubacteria bacterium]